MHQPNQAEPRPSADVLHTEPRTENGYCEQHHRVFKIQRPGKLKKGEGDIQEEGQKSHLHPRAPGSPPKSTDALNMRLRFSISLRRRRERRATGRTNAD